MADGDADIVVRQRLIHVRSMVTIVCMHGGLFRVRRRHPIPVGCSLVLLIYSSLVLILTDTCIMQLKISEIRK
jgi:hypothetical protein